MIRRVNWPSQYDPRRSAIYALNDIDVKAPGEVVWRLLIDAHNWSTFYPHAKNVKIVTGEPMLALGTKYTWTAGISLVNTVQEFVPRERLAWDSFLAEGLEDSSAYHGWIITPTDSGCHLLTEETQLGSFLVEELGHKQPGTLYQYHQDRVETARAADAGATSKLHP
jgi:hypothetical protein